MELKKEQIVANVKRYLATAEKYGFMTPELEVLLGEDFIKAPASTTTRLHNAFEGGLVAHILTLMEKAYKVNKTLSTNLQVDEASLFKVAALCQIGKAKLYIPNSNDYQRKNGTMYTFNNNLASFNVGERSLFYAISCGVDLNEDEALAIINHDKSDCDEKAKWHNSMVGYVIKIANELAIIEEKFGNNG